MWTRCPYHWKSCGSPTKAVGLGSEEGAATVNYFLESMPQGTEVTHVQRWESRDLFVPYDSHKQRVCDDLGPMWLREDVESWLFHGTDCVDAVLRDGFKMS